MNSWQPGSATPGRQVGPQHRRGGSSRRAAHPKPPPQQHQKHSSSKIKSTHRVCLDEGLGHLLLGSVLAIPKLLCVRDTWVHTQWRETWHRARPMVRRRCWLNGWQAPAPAGHRGWNQADCPLPDLASSASQQFRLALTFEQVSCFVWIDTKKGSPSPHTSAGCPAATQRWQRRRGHQTPQHTPAGTRCRRREWLVRWAHVEPVRGASMPRRHNACLMDSLGVLCRSVAA